MQSRLRDTFTQNKYFFFVMLAFWLFAGFMLFTKGYEGSFLELNSRSHNAFTDFLATYFTHLADGIILPFIILVFAWRYDKPVAITSVAVIYGTGIVVQILKHLVFEEWDRPAFLLAENPDAIFLPESPPKHHSFPSGHAASFAGGGLAFAWMVRNWKWFNQVGVGLFTIALCYTRIHLGVHFLGDVFVGTLIGTLIGAVIFAAVHPISKRWVEKNRWDRLRSFSHWLVVSAMILILLRFYQMAFLEWSIGF